MSYSHFVPNFTCSDPSSLHFERIISLCFNKVQEHHLEGRNLQAKPVTFQAVRFFASPRYQVATIGPHCHLFSFEAQRAF
jgi:hypothetical protein